MKFIKENSKIILTVVITAVICTTGCVIASSNYLASQISYQTNYNKNVTTAEGALNDLYKTTSNYLTGEYFADKETVVGTWIDGKSIYRKVYTSPTPPANEAILITGVDTLINQYGSQNWKSINEPFHFPIIYGNNIARAVLSNNNIIVKVTGEYADSSKVSDIKWVFEYTKTTD